ncbi:SPOR domain-containing protein [Azohydromonas sp. G-1-1-14]|uniref:SPOR domain-containing protein n=2 Tax=Azohydromonas caseinilytica TaxID=2728836 RepID=A0A848FBD1_9BURK|nr:SPOR domain-containing protein [Azohydromonas caseinilytica]
MATPADQVQTARARARRRLIGAVVLLALGIVGFPLLFETQPRPLPVEVTIEIPRKDGGAPLVLPSRTAPITESAQDAGREVQAPTPAASAPAAAVLPPVPARPVAPAAVTEARPAAPVSASTPRPAGATPPATTAAPGGTRASAPIRVLDEPPQARDLAKEREAREREAAAREAREKAAREREIAAREAKEREAKEREAREAREKAAREAKEREVAAREAKEREAKEKAAREAREREAAREAVAREALREPARSETVERRYVVQVGAFADAAAASEARARAEKAGVRAYTQVIETDAGRRIRVRVGPFPNREEADKALGKLRAAGLPTALLPQ